MIHIKIGASAGVMVSKLDEQVFMSEFDSHWVPHSYGLVPHQSKKLSKTQQFCVWFFFYCVPHLHISWTPCLINSQTLKMIFQVKSFLCPDKQWPKRAVSTNINKDEDNSLKNHTQNIAYQASSQKLLIQTKINESCFPL